MKIRVNAQRYPLSVFWKLRKSIFRSVRQPHRVYNFFRTRASQRLGHELVKGHPYILVLEPSGYCNLKCPMCARNYMADKKQSGNMSSGSFKKLMDEIGDYLIFLMIFGYGEPLLNPDIFEIIRLAKEKDIFVVLGTNVLLLTEERLYKLMQSPTDLIVVSFDAATEETYSKYRVGGDFNQLVANIKRLSEMKKAQKMNTPLIDIQFLVMKENEEGLAATAAALAKQVNADKYSLKRVASYYTDSEQEKITDFLPTQNRDSAYSIYGDEAPGNVRNSCSYPWNRATVNWDGSVIPCCKDIDNHHVFGNAFNGTPFSDIFNGKKSRGFRRQMKEDINKIEICGTCSRRTKNEQFLE